MNSGARWPGPDLMQVASRPGPPLSTGALDASLAAFESNHTEEIADLETAWRDTAAGAERVGWPR